MPRKHTHKEVKSYIESYEYQLLSTEYKNSKTKLKLQCPLGHIFYMRYNDFNQDVRCPKCFNNKRGQSIKNKYEEVKIFIDSIGYTLTSTKYVNSKTKLKLQCSEGHIIYMKYNTFSQGIRCPICYYQSKSSIGEKEMQQFIASIYDGEILPNDRSTIINPDTGWNLKLDIYLPEINKAIEFNGTYWHSFFYKIKYDKIKHQQCKNNNINLLIIDEQNWIYNKNTCIKIIENFVTT